MNSNYIYGALRKYQDTGLVCILTGTTIQFYHRLVGITNVSDLNSVVYYKPKKDVRVIGYMSARYVRSLMYDFEKCDNLGLNLIFVPSGKYSIDVVHCSYKKPCEWVLNINLANMSWLLPIIKRRKNYEL